MEEYTLEELQKMGAKPAPPSAPTGEAMEEYTPEQMIAMGAKPIPPAQKQNLDHGGNAGAFTRGVAQGGTFGFGDEIGAALQAVLTKTLGDGPQPSLGELYREAARDERQLVEDDIKNRFGASMAGNLTGGALLTAASGGLGNTGAAGFAKNLVTPTNIKHALGAGALMGLGNANLDDPNKTILQKGGDLALGVGGGALGYGIAKGAQKLAQSAPVQAVGDWAGDKISQAKTKATEMAEAYFGKQLREQVSRAGGKMTQMGNIVKSVNLLPDRLPDAEPMEYAKMLRATAASLDDLGEGFEHAATAAGLTKAAIMNADDAASRARVVVQGAKGVDMAPMARERAAQLRQIADTVEFSGEIPKMAGASYEQSIQAIKSAPEFRHAAESIASNWEQQMKHIAPEAFREQELARQMAEQYQTNVVNRANEYFEPSQFFKGRVLPQLKRYGGAALMGAAAGATAGMPVVGALAGIATRPMAKAIGKTLTAPIVTKAWAGALQSIIQNAPEKLGRYGPILAREFAVGGVQALLAADEALEANDPGYADTKAQQMRSQGFRQKAAADQFKAVDSDPNQRQAGDIQQ